MRSRFVLEGVTDAAWNEYLDNVEQIGAPRLLEIYQSAYDDYYSE